MKRYFSKTRLAAIILIAAGYGWASGHYIPVNSSILAYVLEFTTMIALLIMGIHSLSIPENETHKNKWSVTGLSIFSVFLFLINILSIVPWGHYFNANSFGSRNSFASLVPVALSITGNVLWVISIVQNTRGDLKNVYLPKNQYNIL